MNRMLYIIYLVALIWSLYDIWNGKMDQGKKVLWTVVCVLLGFIGTAVYVLAGRKK